MISDTALYQCPLREPHGGGGGGGCTPPVISSAVPYILSRSHGILVSFTLPTTCDSCRLYVYNLSNSLILTVNGICGSSSQLLTTLDTCGHYKFLIKCNTVSCGLLVSDTLHYDKSCGDDGCQVPHITSVVHTGTGNNVHVTYTLVSGCDSCKIFMYSSTGTLITTYTNICGTSDTTFTVSDTCNHYKFLVSCYSPGCSNIKSDTAYYDGCHPTCELPYFTAIGFSHGEFNDYYVTLNYILPQFCDSCRLYMYDENDSLLNHFNYICNTTDTAFQVYDTCATYKFVIKCDNPVCGDRISDTVYHFRVCPNTDSCLAFKPILLAEAVPIPSFLNCGYTPPCITCSQLMDSLTPAFRTIFTSYSGVPYLDSTATDAQSKQNALWARFLNYRTGFTKSTLEYLTAYKNCSSAPPTITMLCASDKPLNDPGELFPPDSTPCQHVVTEAQFITQLTLAKMKDSLLANFDSLYLDKCLSAQSHEEFYVNYTPKEYHYTLYYYDQAGNLVKTIPPAAVKPNYSSTFLDSVKAARVAATDFVNYRNNKVMATQDR
jgi:hypothetical protein